jgi:hypothetical protein
MKLPHFMAHRWGKWEQYAVRRSALALQPTADAPFVTFSGTASATRVRYQERRERRHCEVCGTEQDREVRTG